MQFQFASIPRLSWRQQRDLRERLIELFDCFPVSGAADGTVRGCLPIFQCRLCEARLCEMVGEKFRLCFD